MKKAKNKKILYGVLSTCALFMLCGAIAVTNVPSKQLADYNTTKDSNSSLIETNTQDKETTDNSLSIADITERIDNNKIIDITSTETEISCFAYEPNIENLYKNADIVLIGTFDSNIRMYADGFLIRTETKFNTLEVLKNETDISVDESVIFDRVGGVMTLDKYMENNNEIRADEYTDIPKKERSEYYVVQNYAPYNKLDFPKSDKTTRYIIFLNYSDNRIMPNSMYYGIRELNSDNQIYDYDTNSFIDSDLIF